MFPARKPRSRGTQPFVSSPSDEARTSQKEEVTIGRCCVGLSRLGLGVDGLKATEPFSCQGQRLPLSVGNGAVVVMASRSPPSAPCRAVSGWPKKWLSLAHLSLPVNARRRNAERVSCPLRTKQVTSCPPKAPAARCLRHHRRLMVLPFQYLQASGVLRCCSELRAASPLPAMGNGGRLPQRRAWPACLVWSRVCCGLVRSVCSLHQTWPRPGRTVREVRRGRASAGSHLGATMAPVGHSS